MENQNQIIWNGEPENMKWRTRKYEMANWTIWNREPDNIKQRTRQYEMKNQTISNREPDNMKWRTRQNRHGLNSQQKQTAEDSQIYVCSKEQNNGLQRTNKQITALFVSYSMENCVGKTARWQCPLLALSVCSPQMASECVWVCVHVGVPACVCVHACVWVHVHACVCVCVCVYECVCERALAQYWRAWYVDVPTQWTLQVYSIYTHSHAIWGPWSDRAKSEYCQPERERWRQGGVCSDPYKTGSVPCSVCRWLCCFLPMWWPNLYQKSHAPSHLLTNRPEKSHTVTLADKQTRNITHHHACWQIDQKLCALSHLLTDKKCHAPSHLLTNWPEKSRTITLVNKATRKVTHHHTCQQTDEKSQALLHLFTNWPEQSRTMTLDDKLTRKVTHHHICWQTDQKSHTPWHLLTNRPERSPTITFADKQTREVMHHHSCWYKTRKVMHHHTCWQTREVSCSLTLANKQTRIITRYHTW